MDSYILCGMQYGDEGKGSFVDFLTHEKKADCIIKYNGGSQASHNVTTPEGITHKFSQLGSGMFLRKTHTYITNNMVVNLENLQVEIEAFSKETGISIPDIIKKIHINENAYVVTVYHKLLNRMKEIVSMGTKNRRGSVGTGVSEVIEVINETSLDADFGPIYLTVKQIYGDKAILYLALARLKDMCQDYYDKHKRKINAFVKNTPEIQDYFEFMIPKGRVYPVVNVLKQIYKDLIYIDEEYSFKKCLYSSLDDSFRKKAKVAIFEGHQGLLLDEKYGIKPNTTHLDTTDKYALEISHYMDSVTKIGIVKAFCSRHGVGIFPTEDCELKSVISDPNQEVGIWNDEIRFGWFDLLLFRYAQSINNVDEVYLSCLDQLSQLSYINVCMSYIYRGKIDEKFIELFGYFGTGKKDEAEIYEIRKNDPDLIKYLRKCKPKYTRLCGWKSDISKIEKFDRLPYSCKQYIKFLSFRMNVPITYVSVGPTRKNKIKVEY